METLAVNHIHYSRTFLHNYSALLAPKVLSYIKKLQKNHLRDFSKFRFVSLREAITRLLQRCYNAETIGFIVESLTLEVALYFLRMEMLSRRLDGLRLLTECRQTIISRQFNNQHANQAAWLDATKFMEWINASDVISNVHAGLERLLMFLVAPGRRFLGHDSLQISVHLYLVFVCCYRH